MNAPLRALGLSLLLQALLLAGGLQAQEAGNDPLEGRLQAHIEFLADDLLRGRQRSLHQVIFSANVVAVLHTTRDHDDLFCLLQ